jgi:hypothetical protein
MPTGRNNAPADSPESHRARRRIEPARQRTYKRLCARVEALEDAISHFHNVINELRGRVSTLEKKYKKPDEPYAA